MNRTDPDRPSRGKRFVRLGSCAVLLTLLGFSAERYLAEDSIVAGGIQAAFELLVVIPDPAYVGQLPVYIEFHRILAGDRELTEAEEERLIDLYHRKHTHVDPATSELIGDMYGSLMHRHDLSGTRLRIERDGDTRAARRKSLPSTAWGYRPADSEERRVEALKGLVTNNERLSPDMIEQIVGIIKFDESHRVWRYGNDLLNTWRSAGHFKDTKEFRNAKWSEERRALGSMLKLINRPPFGYNPADENNGSRLMAVRNFIRHHHSLAGEEPGKEMPPDALSDLLVIHQWDEDFRVSLAAWEPVRYGSGIQGLYLIWNPRMHWNKDQLQPPFPWERVPGSRR